MSAGRQRTIIAWLAVVALVTIAVVAPARPAAAQTHPNDGHAPVLFCIDQQGNFSRCRTSTPGSSAPGQSTPGQSTPGTRSPGTARPATAPSSSPTPSRSTPPPVPVQPVPARARSAASGPEKIIPTILIAGGALLAVLLVLAMILVVGRRRRARLTGSPPDAPPLWDWPGPASWSPPAAQPVDEPAASRTLGERRVLEASYRVKESPPTGDTA